MPEAMAVTYVTSSEVTGELVRYIKRELRAGGSEIVNTPRDDATVLRIQPSAGRRVLSVGADGKAREYEVYYTVSFSADKPGSDFRVEPQQITLTRDFIFDPLEALAVSQEQALLEQSMERDLARMVVERLSSAGRSGNSGRSPETPSSHDTPAGDGPADPDDDVRRTREASDGQ